MSFNAKAKKIEKEIMENAQKKIKAKDIILIGAMMIAAGVLLGLMTKEEVSVKDNSYSKASRISGIYIFTDGVPVNEYEKLGEVSVIFSIFPQYDDIKENLIEQCQEEYPLADGLILNLHTGSYDKATAIKFK